jgi:hypothetical protein
LQEIFVMRFAGCAILMLAAVILVIWFAWPGSSKARLPNLPIEQPTGDYVGSNSCQSCHPSEHSTWHGSYHRTMTQVASEESILGDFNNVRLTGKDLEVRLFREKERFQVEMNFVKQAKTITYTVVMTTGSHNRQAYWMTEANDSQLVALPYMYLRAESRWIPRHAGFLGTLWKRETPEIAQFQGEVGRWSFVCIKCHTTFGQVSPTDEAVAGSTLPRVAEFGISCEACHGPGQAHVRAHRSPGSEPAGMFHPGHAPHDRASQVCGQCHSVFFHRSQDSYNEWLHKGFTYRPGDDLMADPMRFIARGRLERMAGRPEHVPDPSESGSFWPDGMIRATGREFNGLIESPCYQRGKLSCLSCHEMHQSDSQKRSRSEWAAGQLRSGMDKNAACTQCHQGMRVETEVSRHTHHAANSPGSQCYNCHMPNTTYGLLKATRSHEITSPSVAAGLSTGRPNACNQCHLDRSLGWSADHLTSWYKQPRAKLSKNEEEVAASVLWVLRGDAGQRAITAWTMGWPDAHQASGRHWQAPLLAGLLDDPYDAVRFVAHKSLKRLPGFASFDYNFVGPPETRTAASIEVRRTWQQSPGKEPFAPAVLISPNGQLRDAEISRLLKLRDDRPIDISE